MLTDSKKLSNYLIKHLGYGKIRVSNVYHECVLIETENSKKEKVVFYLILEGISSPPIPIKYQLTAFTFERMNTEPIFESKEGFELINKHEKIRTKNYFLYPTKTKIIEFVDGFLKEVDSLQIVQSRDELGKYELWLQKFFATDYYIGGDWENLDKYLNKDLKLKK